MTIEPSEVRVQPAYGNQSGHAERGRRNRQPPSSYLPAHEANPLRPRNETVNNRPRFQLDLIVAERTLRPVTLCDGEWFT